MRFEEVKALDAAGALRLTAEKLAPLLTPEERAQFATTIAQQSSRENLDMLDAPGDIEAATLIINHMLRALEKMGLPVWVAVPVALILGLIVVMKNVETAEGVRSTVLFTPDDAETLADLFGVGSDAWAEMLPAIQAQLVTTPGAGPILGSGPAGTIAILTAMGTSLGLPHAKRG